MAGPNANNLSVTHPKLPDIQHPIFRLGDLDILSVRGISRAQGIEEVPGVFNSPSRRYAESASLKTANRKESILQKTLKSYRTEHLDSWNKLDHWVNLDRKYWERDVNAEEEETPYADGAELWLQCEELEYQLLEKINSGGFYHLKYQFLANDPEGRGTIKREVLLIILTTFLGRFISAQQFRHLLERLHLGDKRVITFDAFYEGFKKEENRDPPVWMDPLKRKQKLTPKTAHQVHLELKEAANDRYFAFLKLLPKDTLNPSEFRMVLSKLGMLMTKHEFDKLWKRYVQEGDSVLGIEGLLCALGLKKSGHLEEKRSLLMSALQKVSGSQCTPQPKTNKKVQSKMGNERKVSLSIEKWLKEKFREGARAMMTEFLVYDPEKCGKVSNEDFLSVLAKFHLHLTKDQLGHFLARCGLDDTLPNINYLEFLQCLQTRSNTGMAHKVMWEPGHRFGKKIPQRSLGTSSVLEVKLLKFFHADFNSLLNSFQQADSKHLNTITQEHFRAIIETRYCIKMTDEEFKCLLEKLPVDHHGGIRYLEFLAKFDSSEGTLSLFGGGKTVLTEYSRKPNVMKNRSLNEKRSPQKERTTEQLAEIIKNLLKNNYGSIELAFHQLDDMNTRRLTAESMYQLLKSFDTRPNFSRGEVGKLWETLICNQDQTVDFLQFVRHFGYSTKSSCYPNAKISPPVQGDGDFLIRSRKMNSDTKIIVNILQSKVELLLDDLWVQFKEIDPLNSGCVTMEEFIDILQDMCPDLTEHQRDSIAAKFGHGQNRISYVKFLQPYQARMPTFQRNHIKVSKHERNVPLNQETVQHGLNAITSKLRQKLSSVEWKNLQQTCQKLDIQGSGLLLLPEFRSVIKLCNVVLDEDDIYHIMAHYDKDLAGKINYSKFVADHKN
ncbi:hypothetical protein FKM82_014724 [Ascaphus truei]